MKSKVILAVGAVCLMVCSFFETSISESDSFLRIKMVNENEAEATDCSSQGCNKQWDSVAGCDLDGKSCKVGGQQPV